MYTVFVTGGLASGKGTFCSLLKDKGAAVLNLDDMAKSEMESPTVKAELCAEFGADVIDDAGRIDRALLASRAFQSPQSVQRLNAICHPPVQKKLADILLAGSAQPSASIGLLLVEIPLLAESSGFTDLADEVVCIIADADIRLQRATARGMGAADALDRMALQASDEQRMAISDTVIDNNGGLEALAAQAEDWYARRTMDRLF